METLVALAAILCLGVLAIRFGADSRPRLRSHEHRLADSGMAWDPLSRPTVPPTAISPPAHMAADGPVIGALEPGTTSGAGSTAFPTLQAIDLARDPGQPAFATDPNAAQLEQRARHLTSQHWSEFAWLTGAIDKARFDAVCDALERERLAKDIEVFILPGQSSRIAS